MTPFMYPNSAETAVPGLAPAASGKNGFLIIMSASMIRIYSSATSFLASQSMTASGLLYAEYTSPVRGCVVYDGAMCVGQRFSSSSVNLSSSSLVQHIRRVNGPGWPDLLWLYIIPVVRRWEGGVLHERS